MVYIHRWDINQPRLLVHILHGMAEYGARYGRFAEDLNANGIAVWAHDHPGHGVTAGSIQDLGHFADKDGWRLVVDDAWNVSRQMKEKYRGVPLALFAHSMGSFVGQTLMAERGCEYCGVVLCGTNGPPGFEEWYLRRKLGSHPKEPRTPYLWLDQQMTSKFCKRFEPITTKFDWLSGDRCEVAKYICDPYCGFPLTRQAWSDFLYGKAELGSDAHVAKIPKALPIHLIAGQFDPVGDETKGVKALANLYRVHQLTVWEQYYAGARHELLNEIPSVRDQVTQNLIVWLGQLGGKPVCP